MTYAFPTPSVAAESAERRRKAVTKAAADKVIGFVASAMCRGESSSVWIDGFVTEHPVVDERIVDGIRAAQDAALWSGWALAWEPVMGPACDFHTADGVVNAPRILGIRFSWAPLAKVEP